MDKINLYQANSIDTVDNDFSKDKILDGVKYGLTDYLRYIEKSIKLVQEAVAIRIPLRKEIVEIECSEKDTYKNNSKKETETEIRYYVELEKVSEKIASRIELELFERNTNTVYSEKPTGIYKNDKRYEVKIDDRNGEEKYLIIEEEDDIKFIYLKANDYQLRKQKEAIFSLMNQPLVEHTPIQKLFDLANKTEYYFEENRESLYSEIDWRILKEPQKYDGTNEQQSFVKKALETKDFGLLEGPPGSGKTTAIIELIIQLILQGKRVLLVSSTHVAVDNVIHRILTNYKDQCEGLVVPIRISSNDGAIRKESVIPYRFQTFTKNTKESIRRNVSKKTKTRSVEMLNDSLKHRNDFDDIILKSANLIGGTMIGILQHPDIKKGGIQEMFDVMIVDEASKVTFLDFLVPALYAKKWILVGDVNQLSPYTEDDYINENIDAVIKEKRLKESLVKSFELKRKLNSDSRWDKESVKVFFTNDYNSNIFNGYEVFKITDSFNPETDVLKLNGADVILCKPTHENKEVLSKHLYVKAMLFEDKIASESFQHRQNAFHKNKGRNRRINIYRYEFSTDRKQEWKEMVGSRLSQMYQYRFEPELNKQIKQEYDYLVPTEKQDAIEKIRRIALPSILELLQIGVGEKRRTTKAGDTYSEQKLIYQGFNDFEYVKETKFQSLSYQHRMNDEIASIPREYFYEGKNLETANTVFNREDILNFYKPNEKKVIWVSNKDNSFRKVAKKGRPRNINPTEVEDIKQELESFLALAKSQKNNFEVAVLTFYRDQEFELREMLQKVTNQKNQIKFFKKANVKITLCTVDKFQGDEADLILLSFTKFTKKAFYNSPNRLNVALTRAKYKMVLYGNKEWLAKNAQLKALRGLAEEKQNRLKH